MSSNGIWRTVFKRSVHFRLINTYQSDTTAIITSYTVLADV